MMGLIWPKQSFIIPWLTFSFHMPNEIQWKNVMSTHILLGQFQTETNLSGRFGAPVSSTQKE